MKRNIFILFFNIFVLQLQAQDSLGIHYKASIEEHRREYFAEFLAEEKPALKKENFEYLSFFEPNIAYLVTAQFKKTPNEKPFNITTTTGKLQPYRKYGELHFELESKKLVLCVYQNMKFLNHPLYKDYLFLPFKDLTSGETTYGGGRFIDLKLSDIIDNQVIIDFNKCYLPYCAFAAGYNCPIPPSENFIEVEVPAGVKMYNKHD